MFSLEGCWLVALGDRCSAVQRLWLKMLLFALTCLISVIPSDSGAPVVVLITANDVGINDFGFSGSGDAETENLDTYAEGIEGVYLPRYYVHENSRVSKLALLTGVHPAIFGDQGNSSSEMDGTLARHLDTKGYKLISEVFAKMGARSHYIGTWDLGRGEGSLPTDRGFDSFFGNLFDNANYLSHEFTDKEGRSGLDWYRFKDGAKYSVDTMNGVFSVEALFEEASKRIIEHNAYHRDKPMLLVISLQLARALDTVHCPVPRNYMPRGTDHRAGRDCLLGMVKAIDENFFGYIINILKEQALIQNAVIVFTGLSTPPTAGPFENHGSNGPLRGAQGDLYEGAFRSVAFINSQLLSIDKGWGRNVHSDVFSISDWLPSLSHIVAKELRVDDPFKCAADEKDLCGKDQWECLEMDRQCHPERNLLLTMHGDRGAMIWNDFKYILGEVQGAARQGSDDDPLMSNPFVQCAEETPASGLHPCQLAHGCLYNIKEDPCEMVSISRPVTADYLNSVLLRFNKSVDYSLPVYTPARLKLPVYNQGAWGYYDVSAACCRCFCHRLYCILLIAVSYSIVRY